MERMIHSRLQWILDYCDLYPDVMSGFRRGLTSVDSIIDFATSIEQQRMQSRFCAAIFLHVKGAFDSVNHDAVFSALEQNGFGGRIYSWIRPYLAGRAVFISTDDGDAPHHFV